MFKVALLNMKIISGWDVGFVAKNIFLKYSVLNPTLTVMPLAVGKGALAHPELRSSINPIPTRGADYAHHITACSPGIEISVNYHSLKHHNFVHFNLALI